MSNKEEAVRWLNQGERDLGAAIVLMDKEFYEIACFHFYPDAFPSGSPYEYYIREDADKCIKYAESILTEVRNFLAK